MSLLATQVEPGVSLASILADDSTLYRVAQALLALSGAPGLRTLRLSRHHDRWDAVGLTGTARRYPPPTLSLDAGLSHRAHLHTLTLAPLAVESPQFSTVSLSGSTYTVHRAGLDDLFVAARAVAGALDDADDATRAAWWGRRARMTYAAAQKGTALAALRDAAARVTVTRLM